MDVVGYATSAPELAELARRADPAIVDAARGGDPAAWEALYRNVYPRLKAYMGRRVGREHSEDAVNETMARAVSGIGRFELGPAGFDGWVFGIARRVAADHHRAAERSRRQGDAGRRLGLGIPARDPQGEALVLSEDHIRVREAFDRLSTSDREILELRVAAQLSTEEVAAVLGKRPAAVRTAQSRALARLRDLMSKEPDDGI